MMLLWICLLIGTTTCIPVKNAFSSGIAAPAGANIPLSAPASSWDSEISGLGSSSLPESAGGYVSFGAGAYSNPEASEYGAASSGYGGSAPGSSSYGGYDAGAYEGESSHGFVSAPEYESWSSGSAGGYDAGSEEPQQVFSDVSELEPVYAFSSRSSYQRGRAVFGQTRYTPGEPVAPPMPIYRPIIKIPVQPSAPMKQSPPVKAPPKGGY